MLRMNYGGQVEMLGSGRTTSAWMSRRSVVKIGGQKIRNVMLSDYLDSTLESGVDDGEDTRLSVGWVMFFRWLLAVRHNGETSRESVFLLFSGILTHLIIMAFVGGVVGLLLGAISEGLGVFVGAAIFLFGVATAVLDVKGWLAPPFRE